MSVILDKADYALQMSSLIIEKKVGRPEKYKSENDRYLARTLQNRRNKQKQRLREKLKLKDSLKNDNKTDLYGNYIANFFTKFQYSYIITLTVDPFPHREQLNLVKEQFPEYLNISPLSIPSVYKLKRQTNSFLARLSRKYMLERYFFVAEKSSTGYHIHILLKTKRRSKYFKSLCKNIWKMGYSKCTDNFDLNDKLYNFDYFTKELKIRNIIQTDIWDFGGNFGEFNTNFDFIENGNTRINKFLFQKRKKTFEIC